MDIRTHLTEKEVNSLIVAAPTLRDKVVIQFLFRTGCRVSELCSIDINDVDLNEGLVLIHHLKRVPRIVCPDCGHKTGCKSQYCPGCGVSLENANRVEVERNRQRIIPLDKKTCNMIKTYLEKRQVDSNLMMPLSRQRIDGVIKAAVQQAGLDNIVLRHPESGKRHKVSAHKLRDAFTIRALSLNNTVEAQIHIQQQLGHKSFATTVRYAKFGLDDNRKWYDDLWEDKGAK